MQSVTFTWEDKEPTGAVGWVVLDTIINGVSGGGIFMHKNATQVETADIARNMTRKFTVTNPQIGGAKAGIRFDHTDPRAKEVLRRFILANQQLLNNVWVTAGDLNTDDSFIESVIVKELKLSCCQHMLGVAVAKARNTESLSSNLATLITTQANPFAPLIEATVGYGLAEAIKTTLSLLDPSLVGNLKIMIQGFGAVGSNLAYYLTINGIAKVVGIADKDGFIHNSEGLPIIELLETRKKNIEESTNPEYGKNLTVNLSDSQKKSLNFVPFSGDLSYEENINKFLSSEEADIFSPCAIRYCITPGVAEILSTCTWKNSKHRIIASGANNPFGLLVDGKLVEDKTGNILTKLSTHACVIPDWVGNSGTAQLFHRALSVPFDMKSPDLVDKVLEACARPIRTFLIDSFRESGKNPNKLPLACQNKADKRIKNPIPLTIPDADLDYPNPAGSIYSLAPPLVKLPYEERLKRVLSVAAECVSENEMKELLMNCDNPVAYDGFEPSGQIHIAQGLMKAGIVNKLTSAGFTYLFWVADWFALMNHKMDSNLERIKDVGKYFIEVWSASGMNMDRVKFLWCSDVINSRYNEYMDFVLSISSWASISRIKRCTQIMGRDEKEFEKQSASQVLYSCMQCADIFLLGIDVCQLGLDQRKINMLAREYADAKGLKKPIILSHPMLMGLKKGQAKMGKSQPDSAIFMEDSAEDVARKIKGAFCEEKDVVTNPCIEYFKHIVFLHKSSVKVCDTVYDNFESLKIAYAEGLIHPVDLKVSLTAELNSLLEPVRQHFINNPNAKELLERVKSYKVTR
jgi:tyrosyl-tRNA synthetase